MTCTVQRTLFNLPRLVCFLALILKLSTKTYLRSMETPASLTNIFHTSSTDKIRLITILDTLLALGWHGKHQNARLHDTHPPLSIPLHHPHPQPLTRRNPRQSRLRISQPDRPFVPLSPAPPLPTNIPSTLLQTSTPRSRSPPQKS